MPRNGGRATSGGDLPGKRLQISDPEQPLNCLALNDIVTSVYTPSSQIRYDLLVVTMRKTQSKGVDMSTVPAAITAVAEVALAVDLREVEAVRRILFFDGVCGLCSWSVDFVLKRDRHAHFQFAPLQGETARSLLQLSDVENLDTLVLWISGRTYRKSAAVVRVLWQLGPIWQIVGTLLWLIPLTIRDLGYSIVARNRYRLFGMKETCRLPTPDERLRFLP